MYISELPNIPKTRIATFAYTTALPAVDTIKQGAVTKSKNPVN